VKIAGRRGSEAMKWEFPAEFASGTTPNDFLPRLWATRKIGFLMDEIRLRGEKAELKDEIVQLAKRYGIVTPYTSFLVVEDEQRQVASNRPADAPRVVDAFNVTGGGMGGGAYYDLGASVHGDSAKKQAVRYSMEAQLLAAGDHELGGHAYVVLDDAQSAGQPATHPGSAASPEAPIKVVGEKTFYLSDGRWVDSRYDGKAETKKIKAFSEDYFRLLREHKEFAKYFALGARVVVVADGQAYETVE
jgi:Ca-activated chloride channel family protein